MTTLTAFVGVMNFLSALTPALADRLAWLEPILPFEVQHGARLSAALIGFGFLMLAGQLWRRKHAAWLITLTALAISVVSNLTKGLDYEEVGVSAVVALGLWLLRQHFWARSDPSSIGHGLRVLAGATLFTLVYGVTGFYLLDRHISVNFGLLVALRQTIIMFTQFYDPGLQPITGFGAYFADSIYIVGGVTLGYALLLLARPVLLRQPATAAERAQAQAIVEAHGISSLARFTLFDDKAYFFSQGGSVVAFAVKGRVALALGDPIGPADDCAATLAEFKHDCARNDWQPAFYQTLPGTLDVYRASGFDVMCIGQEAIVDLTAFTREGKAGKDFRTVVNKLTKLGHRAVMRQPPLPDALLGELKHVSDEWLTPQKGRELHFATGWFDDNYIRNSTIVTVLTPEDRVSAFANLVPQYQHNGVAVDLMHRRSDAVHGTMDFLFVCALDWAKTQGYVTFSLGLSALSGIGERADDPAVERALHYIFEHINQFYNFKGLYAFKAKFHPQWSPRYFVYPGPTSLPTVATALIRADTGGQFPGFSQHTGGKP